MPNQKNNLEIYRHSMAHVMAAAIQKLWPAARFGVGPSIEHGFYYDIEIPDYQLKEDDLKKIEKQMKKLLSGNLEFTKQTISIDEAIEMFTELKQTYKVELLNDLKNKGTTKINNAEAEIANDDQATLYTTGDFTDLCRGPHVASTKELTSVAFKLNKLAGAYWRGDEKNTMLTRIYGLAFENKKELADYLTMLAEAEKRDHRKLGQELDLFSINPTVGLGLPLWHPHGALMWHLIEDFWTQEHFKRGYELVRTPHIGSKKLWETSGHWGFYRENMYAPIEVEDEQYLLKPMNCPFHVMIYKNQPKSYRDLPIRWAETGTVYRYEKSGQLSGLTRVRGFTQDDAHIICAKVDVENELLQTIDLIKFIWSSFGFTEYTTYLSLRDPHNKKKYAGNDEGWEFTENILRKVAQQANLKVIEEKGEAAFYGPKLDFKTNDSLGREWQCSTLQFDFNLPERFNMTFKNNQGNDEQPYMLHRALFGSFERFMGLLIEHYAGAFPLWISPVQVKVIAVGEKHIQHCQKLAQELKSQNIRATVDISDETVGHKIHKAIQEKIPYMLVIGDKEINSKNLHVRTRGSDKITEITKDKFIAQVIKLNSSKSTEL